jgi:hypothetical protein
MNPGYSSFELQHAATHSVSLVAVPMRHVIAVDGIGAPTSGEFHAASELLRSIETALERLPIGRIARATMRTLEVTWLPPSSAEDMAAGFADRTHWHWRQFLPLSLAIGALDAEAVISDVARHAGRVSPLVRVDGRAAYHAAQMLHLGTSSTQNQTLAKLVGAIDKLGLRALAQVDVARVGDEDRVPAQRAASIIRVPVEPSAT